MVANVGDSRQESKSGWGHLLRLALAMLGLVGCYHFIRDAPRTGVSRLFQTTAIIEQRIEVADEAVKLTPRDPEAHYTRALELVNLDRLSEAVAELNEATRLRPHHYYEWLDLGVTLDRLGDQTGADAALRESIRLAPFFAQPRWQLGNFLYRQGRYEEAFMELRLGATSNPGLIEGMHELAWVASDGDVGTMEKLVQPRSRRSYLEMADFLARRGNGAGAVRQVREAGVPRDEVEGELLRQVISSLLAAQLFSDAYDAWATNHIQAVDTGAKSLNQVTNGDFVEPIMQNDPGFGWQVTATPNVVISIGSSGPAPGARSVRAEFSGDNPPGSQLIHQLVLLRQKTRYSLTLMARSEKLVTGGPPVIVVFDGSKGATILGQSKPLSTGTSEWTTYQVDFATDENTYAGKIVLQRLGCSQSPCPIFGNLWLSRFSLVKS